MKTINTLILSGGGNKGVSYCGVLKKIDEIKNSIRENELYNINIDLKTILGVSIGSIIGFLYCIGYSGNELITEIYKVNTKKLQNLKIVNLINEWGLDTGDSLMEWVEKLCLKKNINKFITFNELYEKTAINFRVGVTNVNKYQFEIFDKNVYPDTSVLKIIRLSFNLPLIYTKQEFSGALYSDGGITNNYPIHFYKNELDNVLGLKLTSFGELTFEDRNITNFEEYIFNIIYCYVIDKERKLTFNKKILETTIFIETNINNSFKSNLKFDDKIYLIKCGYTAASNYFKKWLQKIKID